MLLEQEWTIVDETSLLMVVNNDWTMIVDPEQLWTMVVDNSCSESLAQHCWQGAAQHCNKMLTTLIKLFIFARVRYQLPSKYPDFISFISPVLNNILPGRL